ncbi:MAG: MerR family transcriptional regulator [Clostridium sp.]|nr:MerR family transcriptional regulator [Clostridium sp.]
MKTIKEVSGITGVSIRTLRYYDEIGLLRPAKLTDSGYRLYDNQSLEKLQEILFFKELEIPLQEIKKIMENPDYDRKQALQAQKVLLEKKRNRLNGIIELIEDVIGGVNTMSFEAFSSEDIQKIINHTVSCMSEYALMEQIAKYGSEGKYREYLAEGFANEQAMSDVIKWYGGKEKALEAMLSATGDTQEIRKEQDENARVYHLFMKAKEDDNAKLAKEAVAELAENYKKMFCLDNARSILLDLAKEYLRGEKLAEGTDSVFGAGCAEYVAHAILNYYGV